MKLYKYLSPERLDVLKNCQIRFTQPTAFNDPFDCLPHFSVSEELNPLGSRFYFLQASPEDIGDSRLKDEVTEHVRKSYAADSSYTLEAVIMQEPIPLEHQGILGDSFRRELSRSAQESALVLSLTENSNNLLMWAHYAKDHTGFVIGFDSTHSYFHSAGTNPSNPGFLNQVKYIDERPSGVCGTFSVEQAYLTKSLDWSTEHEWRILQRVGNATKTIGAEPFSIHLFGFPGEAIAEVVIGARAVAETVNEVIKILSNNTSFRQIILKKAIVDQRNYRLNYEILDF
jgi:Protein of unknown function (DUF2971)